MITVTYHNIAYDDELRCDVNSSGVIKVKIEGHALFTADGGKQAGATKGYNLICAAVSFSAMTLLRSITMIAGINPDYTIKDGLMEIRTRVDTIGAEQKNIVKVLLESFLIGMLDMQKKYPDEMFIETAAENK